jgi:hypothetical protein
LTGDRGEREVVVLAGGRAEEPADRLADRERRGILSREIFLCLLISSKKSFILAFAASTFSSLMADISLWMLSTGKYMSLSL